MPMETEFANLAKTTATFAAATKTARNAAESWSYKEVIALRLAVTDTTTTEMMSAPYVWLPARNAQVPRSASARDATKDSCSIRPTLPVCLDASTESTSTQESA